MHPWTQHLLFNYSGVWHVYVNVCTHAMVHKMEAIGQLSRVGSVPPSTLFLRQVFSYFWHTRYFRLADWWVCALFSRIQLQPPCRLRGYRWATPHLTIHAGSRDWTLLTRFEQQVPLPTEPSQWLHMPSFLLECQRSKSMFSCLHGKDGLSHLSRNKWFSEERLHWISAGSN